MDEQALREAAAAAHDEWAPRRDKVREWRDVRYGRDDVLSTIPEELQATDFEYHSSEMDDAVNELTAFLSAARQTWAVKPGKDRDQSRADDIESVIEAVFGPNGILESEAGGEVAWSVWQNQVENGHGIYKFTLKKDYPLRMPERHYCDGCDDEGMEHEENPEHEPMPKRGKRKEMGKASHRETDHSLHKRREAFMQDEFAWQWRSVDPRNNGYFRVTKDGVVILAGEICERPVSVLGDYDVDIENLEEGYVTLGDPSDLGESGDKVLTFECWDSTHGYFGIMASEKVADAPRESKTLTSWPHPYGRPPYYEAFGLVSTDANLAYRFNGAFGKMVAEIPLLNHLETMHFNSIHRGFFPLYYPVKDAAYQGTPAPMNIEQLVGVTQSDMSRTELPPGYKWEIMPSGFEPDLLAQLAASRERVHDSSIVSVLRGSTAGAQDSGVKISLLLNSARRAISPFTRHHVGPLKEMAEVFLRVNKKLALDTHIMREEVDSAGRALVKPLVLKAGDIVSTAVSLRLDDALPTDAAALQVQGLTLVQAKMASYDTVAPEYFNIGDPQKERERIALEGREAQLDDVAFQAAANRFLQNEPSISAEWFANVRPVEGPKRTVGGGPGGQMGGGAAEMGRGEVASPSAVQVQ